MASRVASRVAARGDAALAGDRAPMGGEGQGTAEQTLCDVGVGAPLRHQAPHRDRAPTQAVGRAWKVGLGETGRPLKTADERG